MRRVLYKCHFFFLHYYYYYYYYYPLLLVFRDMKPEICRPNCWTTDMYNAVILIGWLFTTSICYCIDETRAKKMSTGILEA